MPGPPSAAQQAADNLRSPLASTLLPAPARSQPACPAPTVIAAPVRGGSTSIAVDSPCRTQQLVIFTYAGTIFIKPLDEAGRAVFVLDCFAGDSEPVTV